MKLSTARSPNHSCLVPRISLRAAENQRVGCLELQARVLASRVRARASAPGPDGVRKSKIESGPQLTGYFEPRRPMSGVDASDAKASGVSLMYFDGRGLGELVRWMLHASEIKFDDVYLNRQDEFEKLKEDGMLLFGQLPLLQIDGLKLVQSQSIVRYLARRGNLYGSSDVDAANCDMIADAARDCMGGVTSYPFLCIDGKEGEAKQKVQNSIKKYFHRFEAILNNNKAGKGTYLVGSSLTYADIVLGAVLQMYREISPGCVKSYSGLSKLLAGVLALPGIAAYLKSDTYHAFPAGKEGERYVKNVRTVLGRS